MSSGPNSYILFPDKIVVGDTNIDSVTPDAGGEFVGPMSSEVDNNGALLSVMHGKYVNPTGVALSTDQKIFNCRVQAGGRQNRSTWLHKPGREGSGAVVVANAAGGAISAYGDIVINSIPIGPSANLDAITNPANLPDMSSLAKSIAINKLRYLHQVTATPQPIIIEFGQPIAGGSFLDGQLVINGVVVSGVVFAPNDATNTLRDTINATSFVHGMTASLDSGGTNLVLTGTSLGYESGANVLLFVDATISASVGWTGAATSIQLSGLVFTSDTHISFIGSANPSVIGVAAQRTDSQSWYGYNDMRYAHDQHGGLDFLSGDGSCAVYLEKYNREMLYSAQGTSGGIVTINCAYKCVDDEPDNWTTEFIEFKESEFFGIGYTYAFMQMCSVSDGTLRMVTRSRTGDFNIWSSEDGLNWNIISPSIGMNYLNNLPDNTKSPRFDSSGDYLRLSWMDLDPSSGTRILRTIVSSDGGLSWVEPTFEQPIIAINGDNIDQWVYTMGGIKNDAGTFLLIYMRASFGNVEALICSGTSGWSKLDGFTAGWSVPSPNTKAHFGCVRGIDYFYVYAQYTTTQIPTYSEWHRTGAESVVIRIDPNNIQEPPDWEMYPFYGAWQGAMKWCPANINMINTGKYLSFFSAVIDYDNIGAGFYETNKTMYFQIGGWSQQPIADSLTYQPQTRVYYETDYLLAIGWSAPTGQPAPIGNANVSNGSPWTRLRLGSTSNYSSDRVRLTDSLSPLGDYYYFVYDDSALGIAGNAPTWCPTTNNFVSTVLEFQVKSDFDGTPVAPSATPEVFVRIKSGKPTAPYQQVDISVHMTEIGILLYDNIASGVIVGSEIDVSFTDYVTVRVALKAENIGTFLVPNYVPQVYLSVKQIGGYDEPSTSAWLQAGPFTVSESIVASFVQELSFGMAANPSAVTRRRSYWRQVRVLVGSPLGTAGYDQNNALQQFKTDEMKSSWPRDLRGRRVSQSKVQMGYGISTRWGGAAGSFGDHLNGSPDYQYDPKNMLLPSPRLSYRSAIDEDRVSSQAYELVLVANPDDPIQKFRFNALACFEENIGDVTIDVSDDKISWSNLVTSMRTSATHILAPDNVSAISPNTIRVTLAGGESFLPFVAKYNSSSGHGYYILLTTGSFTRAFKILNTDNITTNSFDIRVQTEINLLSAAWTQAKIYTGRWIWRDSNLVVTEARYIRIRGSNQIKWMAEKYLYAGTIMLGVIKSLEVPFEWTLTDNEQPNITNYKTKGGLAWSYVEGPPQRTITGRFVGDVNARMRESLRQLMRSQTEYEHKPVVLVMDNTVEPPASSPYFTEDFESTSVGSLPVPFTTSGDADWEVETSDAHTGTKCAISQDINDGEESILQYTAVISSQSMLTFWWRCSSEDGFDFLELLINGVQAAQITGLTDWEQVNVVLGTGPAVIRWRYYKDGSVSAGDDHGRVDDITLSEITSITEPRYVDPNNVVLARITSGSQLDNAGWFKELRENDGKSQTDWQVVGDLKIKLEEEV